MAEPVFLLESYALLICPPRVKTAEKDFMGPFFFLARRALRVVVGVVLVGFQAVGAKLLLFFTPSLQFTPLRFEACR